MCNYCAQLQQNFGMMLQRKRKKAKKKQWQQPQMFDGGALWGQHIQTHTQRHHAIVPGLDRYDRIGSWCLISWI